MKEGGGGGEGKRGRKVSFLSSPPPPRLLAPFFARPLLRNSTETLASQANLGRKLLWSQVSSACHVH